jgi:carbonic anhydrase
MTLFRMFFPSLYVFALAIVITATPATSLATEWEKISSDRGRTVEIDASAIFDADKGAKVSWERIVLNDSGAQRAGYRSVRTLNRYDCPGRSFTTLKRIYLNDDGNIIREEIENNLRPVAIRSNSVEGQVWSRVCGLPLPSANGRKAPNSIYRLADTADRAARNALPPAKPESAFPLPAPRPVTPTPPNTMPIPMPSVPQIPAVPVAPKNPDTPAVPQSAAIHGNSEDWSYFGATGPESWGRLRPEWRACAEGKRQSPVDFAAARPFRVDLDPVKFDYRPTNFVIIDSPRQLRVKIGEGMGMEVRGKRYALEGFALHRPGETPVDGKAADVEAYFFHRGDKDRIAVLAVQFMRGGQPNAPLQTLLNNLPLERGDSHMPQSMLDMAALLPTNPAHYLYMGSLTMPPCTEGVLWVVMKEPMTISDEQYEIFSRLHESNARPPQPSFDRLILESR